MQCIRSEVGGVAAWGAKFNVRPNICFLTASLPSRMKDRTPAALALVESCWLKAFKISPPNVTLPAKRGKSLNALAGQAVTRSLDQREHCNA